MNQDVDLEALRASIATVTSFDETLELDATMTLAARDARMVQNAAARRQIPTLPRIALAAGAEASSAELQIVGTLGEGGMGLVRLARQVALDREVAVKTTRPEASRDGSLALLDEALITGRLEHPNIVPVYTLGRDDHDAPQIVMKRIEGTLWSERLAEEPALSSTELLDRHIEILLHVPRGAARDGRRL